MKQLLVATITAVVIGLILLAQPAFAADVFKDVDCSGKAADSALCQDKGSTGNPLTGNNGAIMKIANIVASIAGIAAVIIIVVSGLRFVTGGGDANEIAGARRAIIYAVIGLVVVVSARFIIGLIVRRL